MENENQEVQLNKTLGPVMLWGLGVGYVISGEYFGWNLGLSEGGTYGMLLATLVVTLMYTCFVLSYAELACAIPRAGGAFVYASRAFGPKVGFLTGLAQVIEFVFAPPAIAMAIGAYCNNSFPDIDAHWVAVIVYVVFTALNIYGVRLSAAFELGVTILAVGELLLFVGITLPEFKIEHFARDPLPGGWMGAFACLPFAIWFYLAIEGVANVAEESKDPAKDIPRGFLGAIATLVVLALLVFFAATGVGGWEKIVFDAAGNASDSPLPMALELVVGREHIFYQLLITVGIFGLIASFHGIILIAGRATFEMGRVGNLPAALGKLLPGRKTPAMALVLNMLVGFVAIALGRTGEMITLSVFGALGLYIMGSAAVLKLRESEPELERPYRAPGMPWLPRIALVIALGCLVSMVVYHTKIAVIFGGLMLGGWGYYRWSEGGSEGV